MLQSEGTCGGEAVLVDRILLIFGRFSSLGRLQRDSKRVELGSHKLVHVLVDCTQAGEQGGVQCCLDLYGVL